MIHIIHNYYQEHQFFIFASYLALFILFDMIEFEDDM